MWRRFAVVHFPQRESPCKFSAGTVRIRTSFVPVQYEHSLIVPLCRRWWGFKVLSRIPSQDHDEVMLKAAAYDCLGGKRNNWALQTRWHGNYLAKVSE